MSFQSAVVDSGTRFVPGRHGSVPTGRRELLLSAFHRGADGRAPTRAASARRRTRLQRARAFPPRRPERSAMRDVPNALGQCEPLAHARQRRRRSECSDEACFVGAGRDRFADQYRFVADVDALGEETRLQATYEVERRRADDFAHRFDRDARRHAVVDEVAGRQAAAEVAPESPRRRAARRRRDARAQSR